MVMPVHQKPWVQKLYRFFDLRAVARDPVIERLVTDRAKARWRRRRIMRREDVDTRVVSKDVERDLVSILVGDQFFRPPVNAFATHLVVDAGRAAKSDNADARFIVVEHVTGALDMNLRPAAHVVHALWRKLTAGEHVILLGRVTLANLRVPVVVTVDPEERDLTKAHEVIQLAQELVARPRPQEPEVADLENGVAIRRPGFVQRPVREIE